MNRIESAKMLAEFKAELGLERQKKENTILRKDNEYQSNLRIYLYIIIALALALALLAFGR